MSCTSRTCFEVAGKPGQANAHAAFPTSDPEDASRATYEPVLQGTETGNPPLSASSLQIHHHPKVTKDAFVNVQTSMAIVSGLVMGIAVSGFFADVAPPPSDSWAIVQTMHNFRLVVWCAALFGALMSTGCSVYSIIQVGFLESDDQVNAYLSVLDDQPLIGGQAVLNLLIVVPFFFMMIAIPQHMFLSHIPHRTNHTIACLSMCLMVCPLPFAAWFFIVSRRAFLASSQPAPNTLSGADETASNMMYGVLQKYVEHKGSIFAVHKKEFLELFGNGEVERELAEMLFDDWKQKRLKSMLREDPGF